MTDHIGELAFFFDAVSHRTTEELTPLLGGKGAGLVAMAAMGLPVPVGFTITTAACRRYLRQGWDSELDRTVRDALGELEARTGRRLGDRRSPLLVSVRSGAATSMPGMLDTVLDVGMSDDAAAGLVHRTGDETFATDTRRRSLLSHAAVVGGASAEVLADAEAASSVDDVAAVLDRAGIAMAEDPHDQVVDAVRAVFASWGSDRAHTYRGVEEIDPDDGTAVTVQEMVFGNLGPHSGTGVAFSRDPSTGEAGLMGDLLVRAQGEDVVAGGALTEPVTAIAERWPEVWERLGDAARRLERHFADMVDIEFTVEHGRLWLLQARRALRTPMAALRAAVDMAEDPDFPVDRAEAVRRCRDLLVDPPRRLGIVEVDDAVTLAEGVGASPGWASGQLCIDVDRAVALDADGVDVILFRAETSPADVQGMIAARGIVTVLGGRVSHAAVVARSWGLPCVVGVSDLVIEADGVRGPGGFVPVGAEVTIDGTDGRVLRGVHAMAAETPHEIAVLQRWATGLDGLDALDGLDGEQSGVPADDASKGPVVPGHLASFAVRNALRIKAMATAATVADMTGLAVDRVEEVLRRFEDDDAARYHEGRERWQLTATGVDQHRVALAEQRAVVDVGALPYDDFLRRNRDFLDLCDRWQVRSGAVNDHEDHDYDAAVIESVVALHRDVGPLVDAIADVAPWMARYRHRLDRALRRLTGGDGSALTGVLRDSYHDVWMELHQDLLLLQDIDRADEGSG